MQFKAAHICIFLLLFLTAFPLLAQETDKKAEREARALMREAREAMSENDFASAEAAYRLAIAKDPDNAAARYNMGNLYYAKEKTPEAESRLRQAAERAETRDDKHKAFHNLGNSFMKQKRYKEAVEAYKNALRNNPKDDETRYNYALAKKMLEEEEQEGGGGGGEDDQQEENEEQDQNQGGDGDNEQEQPRDEGEQEQEEPQEGEGEKDQPQDEGEGEPEQEQQGDNQQQQPQPAQGQLSPEQIKSLLEAMENEERKIQDKINAEKAKGARSRSEKDW
ncbi:tetratricopeptide repeat protein [Salegentibacter sp. HM20]